MAFINWLNGVVWGPPMLILLVGTGILLTIRLKFLQIRKFGFAVKTMVFSLKNMDAGEQGDITPFQALSTALAATVGTGNIAGVATAIFWGGPGAIFWMWITALVGMTTKFTEAVLAVNYRIVNAQGKISGGPMYYLQNGIKNKTLGKTLAVLFAVFGAIAAFGIGSMVQANSVALAVSSNFNIPTWATGAVLVILTTLVVIGGINRIANVTDKIVPFMALFYVIAAVIVLLINIESIPQAFAMIFRDAFTGSAAAGGFAGSTVMMAMRYGVARGVFSNEAGLGSAPIAHAAAKNSPVQQGVIGILETFIDTIVICTLTALVIITSGLWNSGLTSSELTSAAFNAALPVTGGYLVAIGIIFFAFSTMIGWSYYGEKCFEYLFGLKTIILYKIVFIATIFLGAVREIEEVWAFADTANGLMAAPNLIGLIALSGVVVKLTKDYFNKIDGGATAGLRREYEDQDDRRKAE